MRFSLQWNLLHRRRAKACLASARNCQKGWGQIAPTELIDFALAQMHKDNDADHNSCESKRRNEPRIAQDWTVRHSVSANTDVDRFVLDCVFSGKRIFCI